MTALVERDDVVAVGEGGRHPVEPVRVRRPAVQEAERRPARLAPLERIEREAVHRERAPPRRFAAERELSIGDHGGHCSRRRRIFLGLRRSEA